MADSPRGFPGLAAWGWGIVFAVVAIVLVFRLNKAARELVTGIPKTV